ncbi:MAG: ferritin-like domain-containing protein [Polyangiaceae bacterium]
MRKPIVLLLGSIAASAIAGAVGCSSPERDCNPPPSREYAGTLSADLACSTATDWLERNGPASPGTPITFDSAGDQCTLGTDYANAFLAANRIPVSVDPVDGGDGGSTDSGGSATDAATSSDAATSDSGPSNDGGILHDASPDAIADAGSDAKRAIVCPPFTGSVTKSCSTPTYMCGRPFEGYESQPVGDGAQEFLRACMHLEAASVTAFDILGCELAALGADASLVEACRKAAHDERRHAHAMGELVDESAVIPSVLPRNRSALEIAIDNACEGMVRETYGAVVGLVQAANASRKDIRDAFARIAPDELEHASLSWRIGEYLDTLLTEGERALVRRAAREAVASLERELMVAAPSDLTHECGVPSTQLAQRLVSDLKQQVWMPAFEHAA